MCYNMAKLSHSVRTTNVKIQSNVGYLRVQWNLKENHIL